MPVDNVPLFAALDEPARAALLPPESVAEFGNLERKPRDYALFFRDHFVQSTLLADSIRKTTSNIERLEAAAKETLREVAFREGEKASLTADLGSFQRELSAIASYQQVLETRFAEVRQSLRATYFQNRRLAGLLTSEQLQAAGAIDARTNVPAPAAP
jgi:septal ring factor EnvC (AmiA/AmiB activator)